MNTVSVRTGSVSLLRHCSIGSVGSVGLHPCRNPLRVWSYVRSLTSQDSVELMERVRFNQAYQFAYSMRAKTHAHHKLTDDVPAEVKSERLAELIRVSDINH